MTIYTNTARFDGTARALTEDELRSFAPSVFAIDKHESRSDRFRPIPTIEIIRGLAKEGFSVVGAQQSNARDASRVNHTKHMLRIRKLDDDRVNSVGDVVSEMILKNANDGTSVYDLMAGLFRVRCANSLVVQVSTIDSVKVRHSGDVMTKVIEGTYSVINGACAALEAPSLWGRIELDRDERRIFAEAAHVMRFGDEDGEVHTPIQPHQLLSARRVDDMGHDLWKTFNVAQENVIRGGLQGVGRDANNRTRRVTTRSVNGIDQTVKLNKALWLLADKMAELKGEKSLAA